MRKSSYVKDSKELNIGYQTNRETDENKLMNSQAKIKAFISSY